MTLLLAVIGVVTGSLLCWAGDYLPRFASNSPAPVRDPGSLPVPALWHLLISSTSQRSSPRSQKSSWLGITVELFSALLFAYLWKRFGASWKLLSLAFNCSFFLLIAIIDLKYRLIPNVLVYPAAVVVLLCRSIPPGSHPLNALLGGAIGMSPLLLVALLKPGSMGGGDVKLAALIGLMAGFPHVLWPLSLGILSGGGTSIFLLLTHRQGLKSRIPYAPFLCLGAMVSLVYNPISLFVSF